MQRRELRHAAGEPGVWRVPHVVRVHERAEPLRRGEAADPRDVRLDDVDGPAPQELAEAEDTEFGLTRREGDRLRPPDELVAVDVVGINRLLEEPEVVRRER